MKRLPFLLLAAVLVLCSCKNPQELINEKAEQYKKEGKIILNKSDDPSGKDHYIVFADTIEQTIGVDTLGEKAQIIKLGDLVEKRIDIPGIQLPDKFYVISNDPNSIKKTDLKVNEEGNFSNDTEWNATFYKDKYLILETKPDYDLGCSKKWSVLWFKDPQNIYTYKGNDNKDVVLDKNNGDIKITIKSAEDFGGPGMREWVETTYNVTFDCNGKIKQQDDYVDYQGTSVPIKAFGDVAALKPYIDAIETSIIIGNAQTGNYEEDNSLDDWEAEMGKQAERENKALEKWLAKHPEYADLDPCDQIRMCHEDTGFDFDISATACR